MNFPPHGPHYAQQGPGPWSPGDLGEHLLAQPFNAVAPALRVLLTGDPSALGTDKLAYSINPLLTALIAYRTRPDNYESVILDKRHPQAWGMSKQDLWFIALRNMAYDQLDVQSYPPAADTDTTLTVVRGIGWAGSAQVMRLPDIAQEPMPFGALVALPDANTMVYFVLRSQRSKPLIPFLFQVFQSLAQDQEPVTQQLVWWHGGKVLGLPARSDPSGDGVQLYRNEEFNFMLEHELPA